MKCIFLDIDGVLNTDKTKEVAPSGCTGIEDNLVSNLRYIVSKTDAKIILTSTWKLGWESVDYCCSEDAKYLNLKMKEYGLTISGKTYDEKFFDSFMEDRGRGIHDLLDKLQGVEAYVVIDDNVYVDYDNEIMRRLILTDYREGLTKKNAEEAIMILNEK